MLDKTEIGSRLHGQELDSFTCRTDDSLWTGIERALDNGFGTLFVLGEDGTVRGQATLESMREAIRNGAHLKSALMSDVCKQVDLDDSTSVTTAVLDASGRLIEINLRPEATFLPIAEPNLSHAELRNLLDAYLSTWISSTGSYVRDFETRFARKAGSAHGIATSNGTAALQLALVALGIGQGDEVIVPDFTFAASANTVIHAGARPVLVDVDPESWCISLEAIERAITPRTRAVMPVHVFGRPAPMTEIRDLCSSRGIYVIEDCAEAHGARYDGKPVGSFSDISSFSFYANKIITTGEGGMCVTNDEGLSQRMKMLRDHGMKIERRYWHEEAGFNLRMTNLQASIGCAQLDRMDEFIGMRHAIHHRYVQAMSDVAGVTFPTQMNSRCEPVTWFSCVLVPETKRSALIGACKAENIELRPFFNSLSMMPAYLHYARVCPVSRSLSLSGVNLPTFHKVDERMVHKIAGIFRTVLN